MKTWLRAKAARVRAAVVFYSLKLRTVLRRPKVSEAMAVAILLLLVLHALK